MRGVVNALLIELVTAINHSTDILGLLHMVDLIIEDLWVHLIVIYEHIVSSDFSGDQPVLSVGT